LVSIAVLVLYMDVRVCECVLYACVRGHVWMLYLRTRLELKFPERNVREM